MAITIESNLIDTFVHYLNRLKHLVIIIEQYENANPSAEGILAARLHADMLPLVNQIKTTANFALRACCPLTDTEAPSFNYGDTFGGLLRQIGETTQCLVALPESTHPANNSEGGNHKLFQDKAGFSDVALAAPEFVCQYALPNFFFHLSMVYAIARNVGVPLSKGDFDGYHQYPSGFNFEH